MKTLPYTATLTALANLQDVSNGEDATSIPLDTGAILTVWMTDTENPAKPDSIGMQLYQSPSKAGGLWFSSDLQNGKTAQQAPNGGALNVH